MPTTAATGSPVSCGISAGNALELGLDVEAPVAVDEALLNEVLGVGVVVLKKDRSSSHFFAQHSSWTAWRRRYPPYQRVPYVSSEKYAERAMFDGELYGICKSSPDRDSCRQVCWISLKMTCR